MKAVVGPLHLGQVISRLCKDGRGRSCSRSRSLTPRVGSPGPGRLKGEIIPYRDSKLTRLLRNSLGGDAVTLLLVTLHPAARFAEQTLTSLRFAQKARAVENVVPAEKRDVERIIEAL